MASNSLPENQPKDKIQWLISRQARAVDQRISERRPVEKGTEVIFPLICRGEVVDISREGISIRFKPEDSPKLETGQTIPITLEVDDHVLNIPAIVRRVETRFGIIIMGMQFDPENIKIEE
ncbi:PilZ domain-containing protein [bacterium]|nr:PilZ domain-containing protein [candidate division CSSED10-310 bacterium]